MVKADEAIQMGSLNLTRKGNTMFIQGAGLEDSVHHSGFSFWNLKPRVRPAA